MTWRNPSIRFWDSQIKQKHYSSSQGCSQITWDHRCGRPSTEGSAAGSLPSCFPVFSNSFPFRLTHMPTSTSNSTPEPSFICSYKVYLQASVLILFRDFPLSLCSWWGGSGNSYWWRQLHSFHSSPTEECMGGNGQDAEKGRQPWGRRTSSLLRPGQLRLWRTFCVTVQVM